MNIELLEKVKARILAEPEAFDMTYFYNRHPVCGTTACIAGHAAVVGGAEMTFRDDGMPLDNVRLSDGREVDVETLAEELLDLSYDEHMRLFYLSKWPAPFKMDYVDTANTVKQAEIAAARIDHFIATGGAE